MEQALEALEPADIATEGDPTSPDARDYEAEARKLGWLPKDEFKGDDARWTDAETFVKRGEEMLPLVKAQNKKLREELDDLKRQVRKASEYFSKAEQRGYEQALADIERRHAQAVEEGDTAAANKAARDLVKLEKEFDQSKADAAPVIDPAEVQKTLNDWMDKNDWYVLDDAKRRYADMQAERMGEAKDWPGGLPAWLGELEKRVDAKFTERRAPVNAAPGQRAPVKAGKSYADLPPEAKKLCDKWVAQGVIKSRDDYVKNFDWS